MMVKIEAPSVQKLPEPSKGYVMKERSEEERKKLLMNMQELMNHLTIGGEANKEGSRGNSEDSQTLESSP